MAFVSALARALFPTEREDDWAPANPFGNLPALLTGVLNGDYLPPISITTGGRKGQSQ
jgi:hypothetical protein